MAASSRGCARRALTQRAARLALSAWLLASLSCERDDSERAVCKVTSAPEELELDAFYQKYCDAEGGLPILTSDAVSDEALTTAAALVARVLGDRPLIREPLVAAGARITLLGEHEHLPQVPEAADVQLASGRDPEALRGIALPDGPVVAIASEEDVLCWFRAEEGSHSTLLHELAHLIHLVGLRGAQREGEALTFLEEVSQAYESAMENGLWIGMYADVDEREYWAVGVGLYFNGPAEPKVTGQQVGVEDREGLRHYDPRLFELLDWVFGDDDWYPTCPKRKRARLAGKECTEPYAGDDVMSFALFRSERGTSISGTAHLPEPLEGASAVMVSVSGRSGAGGARSTMQLAPGTRNFRYTIENVPPGEYLVKLAVDADNTDFAPETFWVGTYNGMGEGSYHDRASVGTLPRCGVDVTLYTPEQLDSAESTAP